ncbi:hypothetical protein DPMN_065189 [Dreissena polymorpha]|uniref:Uncharacterized protein n=1 Tax=Dreissena polymorpha TaxID=45954 RepID=A0A9D4CF18_DREPO|nr:hypothetical protein DPMN_065189 [Dreissena polymorpha]
MGISSHCLPGFQCSKKNKLILKRKISCHKKESPTKKNTRYCPTKESLCWNEKMHYVTDDKVILLRNCMQTKSHLKPTRYCLTQPPQQMNMTRLCLLLTEQSPRSRTTMQHHPT